MFNSTILYGSKKGQITMLLPLLPVLFIGFFCLMRAVPAGENGLVDAIKAANVRDTIAEPEQIQRIRQAVRHGEVPSEMQTEAVSALVLYILRYNDRKSLEALVQAIRERSLEQSVQEQLFLTLPRIEKNWGEDVLNREILYELLEDFPHARGLLERPEPEAEEVKKQFEDALTEYKNLPFDPFEKVDDRVERSERRLQMRRNNLVREIRLLLEHDIDIAIEELRELAYESNRINTVSACLKYLSNFDAEGSREDFVFFFDNEDLPSIRICSAAVRGLLKIGDKESVEIVGRYLVDNPYSKMAANIIGAISRQRVKEAENYLIQYVEKNGEHLSRAIEALGKIGGETTVEFLSGHTAVEQRSHLAGDIVKALVELESEQAMDILLEGLKSESWYFRQVSAELLADTDSRDAIPQLRDALKSAKDAEERVIMLTSLARLGDKTAEQELLEKYEEADTYEFKRKMIQSFAHLNGRPLSIALDSFDDTVLRIGRHKIQDILFKRAEEIKSEIIDYLKDRTLSEHNFSTEIAFRCLLEAEPQDEESIELLKKAYEDYSKGSVRAVDRFAPLRGEIARYLEEVTGEEFRYTYFRQMPYR